MSIRALVERYWAYLLIAVVLVSFSGLAGMFAYQAEQQANAGRAPFRMKTGQPRPSFTLTDTAGRPFDFAAETRGRLTLLYFGYTNCPDVCPIHFANLSAGLQQLPLEVRRNVRVVFVGVDPPRDSSERIREWLDHFDRSYIGLTGTDEELKAAQTASDVPAATRDPETAPGRYSVSHAGWVIAYTANDEETWEFPLGVRQESWARSLKQLARVGGK